MCVTVCAIQPSLIKETDWKEPRTLSEKKEMVSKGPCGKFRFQEYPDIRIGLVALERKRPWPSCQNPKTGNQWSDDMKEQILQILNNLPFQVFRSDLEIANKVDDDSSLRIALGK